MSLQDTSNCEHATADNSIRGASPVVTENNSLEEQSARCAEADDDRDSRGGDENVDAQASIVQPSLTFGPLVRHGTGVALVRGAHEEAALAIDSATTALPSLDVVVRDSSSPCITKGRRRPPHIHSEPPISVVSWEALHCDAHAVSTERANFFSSGSDKQTADANPKHCTTNVTAQNTQDLTGVAPPAKVASGRERGRGRPPGSTILAKKMKMDEDRQSTIGVAGPTVSRSGVLVTTEKMEPIDRHDDVAATKIRGREPPFSCGQPRRVGVAIRPHEATTPDVVQQLQRILLSAFPPVLRESAVQDLNLLPTATSQCAEEPRGGRRKDPEQAFEVSYRSSRKRSSRPDFSASESSRMIGDTSDIIQMLHAVCGDKMFVRGAWERYHRERRRAPCEECDVAPPVTRTCSGHLPMKRRRLRSSGEAAEERSRCIPPSSCFSFVRWGDASQDGLLKTHGAVSSQSAEVFSLKPDPCDSMGGRRRKSPSPALGVSAGANRRSMQEVDLRAVLTEEDQRQYARFALSSGKLRHECIEPFQFLSKRMREVRECLGGNSHYR